MRTRAGAAVVLTTAVVLGGAGWTAAAAPGDPATQGTIPTARETTTTPQATPRVATVTLLTGDRAVLTQRPDGSRAVSVLPAAGREHITFFRHGDGDHLYVVPSDVAHLVGDRLDAALFDVVGLVEAGYDDGSRDTLPVIVQAAGAPGALARAQATPDWAAIGLSPDRDLESVGAVADDLPKGRAADLLAALQTDTAPSARSAGGATDLRVWLDAPVRTLDADSTPQIGAPEAWAAGYTGAGVTVAVLDTGIDASHPDLDETVTAEADFTESGGVTDGHGHGTHVASIVAGSGEASDGANRGVAPDADLLVGKVLDDGGFGEMSWIIDGMEWAAESGADVVSMSLGGSPTDGTDPGALAVDALSAQYGTLFVIAAGNAYEYGTIGTPGSASSALTVGAVNDDDQVTDFSSRGPRAGDHAIKPDVTAPGEGIVAARAAGTAMGDVVDDRYTAASGTSMATPHVAGAAAVLKQARPELTGPQLKSLLMASAHPTGGTVWDEGAGRIDLPAAIATRVTASPDALSLGAFEYPHETDSTGTLTYTNPTARDLTLDLAVSVTGPDGAPFEGAVALSAGTLTVPAGGSASADITVDQSPGTIGRYSGAVVATSADGTAVRTPLGWYKEPELFDLTISALGADGEAWTGQGMVTVQNVTDGSAGDFLFLTPGEPTTIRVPEGTYSVLGHLLQEDADYTATALVATLEPEFAVSADTTVVLDSREAEPVSLRTHRPADVEFLELSSGRLDAAEVGSYSISTGVTDDVPLSVTPTEEVSLGSLEHTTSAWLAGPARGDAGPGYTYNLVDVQQGAVSAVDLVGDARTTAAVTTTYHELGPDATALVGRLSLAPGQTFSTSFLRSIPTPAKRVEYLQAGDLTWATDSILALDEDSVVGGFFGEFTELAAGGRYTESQFRAVVGNGYRAGVASLQGANLLVAAPWWTDGDGRPYAPFFGEADATIGFRVWEDGELVAENADGIADLAVPSEGARYRVALDAARETPYWALSTQVSTEWEFEAAPVGAEDFATLPVLDVAYDVKGLDKHNAAHRRATVTLSVGHAKGTEGTVEGARLWWSADDGTTWHPARLTRDGENTFTAKVTAPRGTEHVSLKVEAWDEAGSTVKQSVVRAYTVD